MESENNLDRRSEDPKHNIIIVAGRVPDPDQHYFGKLHPNPH
jgi:hypothetical protein